MTAALLTLDPPVATIRFNRPEALNAFNDDLLSELERLMPEVESDPTIKAVVFEGDARAFSAGADLKMVSRLFDDWPEYVRYVHRMGDLFARVERCPVPTIAKVRGYALAGGIEFILSCDIAIAADDAKIGDQHANFGLIAGGGGIPRLIRRVGSQKAYDILYTGRWLSGKEAADYGVVLKAVPAEDLDREVASFIEPLASKSRTSFAYIKKAALAFMYQPMSAALAAEQSALFEYFSTSPDPRKGLEAFLKKNAPLFD